MVDTIFGRKLGMSRYFLQDGEVVPVTIIQAGPCYVIQKKSVEREGYNAIQVGFIPQKEQRINKPLRGHFEKAGCGFFKYLREIRVEDPDKFELGQAIRVDIFQIGDLVQVSGKSKGRGFQGVMKRWGFAGGRDSHGAEWHRKTGSIGPTTFPGRVIKGKKLPGRMGNSRVTIKNLKVIDVRPEENIIAIKGGVPGSRNSIVEIKKIS